MQIYQETDLISGNRVNTRVLEAVKASARFVRNWSMFKIKHTRTHTWNSRRVDIIVLKLTAVARYFYTKNVLECIA